MPAKLDATWSYTYSPNSVCGYQKLQRRRKVYSFDNHRRSVAGMLKLKRSIVSRLAYRFSSRAVVELENLALRHQLHVLRRQRLGRLRLFAIDRLLWVLLYRLWPRCLETMVLVKPATVIRWHRQGFRLFWRWRSKIRAAVRGTRDSRTDSANE